MRLVALTLVALALATANAVGEEAQDKASNKYHEQTVEKEDLNFEMLAAEKFQSMSLLQQKDYLRSKVNELKPTTDDFAKFAFGDDDIFTSGGDNPVDDVTGLNSRLSEKADQFAPPKQSLEANTKMLLKAVSGSLCHAGHYAFDAFQKEQCNNALPGSKEHEKCGNYLDIVSFLESPPQTGTDYKRKPGPDEGQILNLKTIGEKGREFLQGGKLHYDHERKDVRNLGALLHDFCDAVSDVCKETEILRSFVFYLEWCLDSEEQLIAVIIQIQQLIIDIRADIYLLLLNIHWLDILAWELRIEIGILIECIADVKRLAEALWAYYARLIPAQVQWGQLLMCLFGPCPFTPFVVPGIPIVGLPGIFMYIAMMARSFLYMFIPHIAQFWEFGVEVYGIFNFVLVQELVIVLKLVMEIDRCCRGMNTVGPNGGWINTPAFREIAEEKVKHEAHGWFSGNVDFHPILPGVEPQRPINGPPLAHH